MLLRRRPGIQRRELLVDPLLVSHHLGHERLLLRGGQVRHLLHGGMDLLLLLNQGLLHLLRVLRHLLRHWLTRLHGWSLLNLLRRLPGLHGWQRRLGQ